MIAQSPGDMPAPATRLPALQAPGLWRRMACWIYEGMLLFGVVFIAGYLFGTLSQTRNAMDNRHALQAFLGDQGVDLCGRQRTVPQKHLQCAQIRAVIEQVGRERMPEHVRADFLGINPAAGGQSA